ncbi:nickel-responsive transcriptional regulator NikR [Virgibacillus halophilus]|uniref:Putative nickel-responsive regulator n=1 Tax=Tigheibacillus halophilus TaxID=361280 RepID=A0ABU5C7L1_9BACI|nr:nickel-responsive transcriptional regulator NikR [Virgibacillus halophilus]
MWRWKGIYCGDLTALYNKKGYVNRSEAIRDLVRDALLRHVWDEDEQIAAGSILLFYNHHRRNLMEELTNIQHEMHDQIMATTHFHLDNDHCLEMIIVKGKPNEIQRLSNQLTSLKGVDYGRLTLAPLNSI